MRRKVQQIYEGQWTEWNKKDRLQCCDCLLIHDVHFRIRKSKLELRMYRNDRSTAAYRRHNGVKLACKKKEKGTSLE